MDSEILFDDNMMHVPKIFNKYLNQMDEYISSSDKTSTNKSNLLLESSSIDNKNNKLFMFVKLFCCRKSLDMSYILEDLTKDDFKYFDKKT